MIDFITIRPLESASFEHHDTVDSHLHADKLVDLGGETAAKVLSDHHMIGWTVKLVQFFLNE